MPHIIEQARSGRAKCRGCGGGIAAGALRFGERLTNPYAEGDAEMTQWFHVPCAAFLRPEAFLEMLATPDAAVAIEAAERDHLEREARLGAAHHRLPRATVVGRATSGRAACRSCKEPIAKDTWRISLVYYQDGRFAPSGFIHLACAASYLETTDVMGRLRHFSAGLSEADWAEVRAGLDAPAK